MDRKLKMTQQFSSKGQSKHTSMLEMDCEMLKPNGSIYGKIIFQGQSKTIVFKSSSQDRPIGNRNYRYGAL